MISLSFCPFLFLTNAELLYIILVSYFLLIFKSKLIEISLFAFTLSIVSDSFFKLCKSQFLELSIFLEIFFSPEISGGKILLIIFCFFAIFLEQLLVGFVFSDKLEIKNFFFLKLLNNIKRPI